jgi:hypothetical protein
MNCEELKNILLENSIDEIPNSLIKEIDKHSEECGDCSLYLAKMKRVEKFVSELKNNNPVLYEEEFITKSVMAKIKIGQETILDKFFERTIQHFQRPVIRLALTSLIVFFSTLYFYQEYDAVVKISNLEKRYNKISSGKYSGASMLSQTFESATWLYNFYKYFVSESDYVKISDNMIVIRKNQLAEILQLKKDLFPEEDSLLTKEIRIDKNKISKKIDLLKAK